MTTTTTMSADSPLLAAVRTACASVCDPEFGVSIEDLGLIYDVSGAGDTAIVAMTLTTPHCPAGQVMLEAVRAACTAVPGVAQAEVRLVWDPAWTPEMVSPRGRAQLGWV
jgi:metal-sulfur cluster biosynthetic enzyme